MLGGGLTTFLSLEWKSIPGKTVFVLKRGPGNDSRRFIDGEFIQTSSIPSLSLPYYTHSYCLFLGYFPVRIYII